MNIKNSFIVTNVQKATDISNWCIKHLDHNDWTINLRSMQPLAYEITIYDQKNLTLAILNL